MRALLTPQLADHKKHVIVFDGALTKKRKTAIISQLRRLLGLDELDADTLLKVSDLFIENSVTVRDFTCKTASSNASFWDMNYHGGGSYCEKRFVRVTQWNDESKTLDNFKEG